MQRSDAAESNKPAQIEMALLVACARAYRDANQSSGVQALLAENVDWSRCLALAQRHKTLPLLYRALRFHQAAVPESAMQEMRSLFRSSALRSLRLTQEMVGLLRSLQAVDVRAVAYRGPILALSAYGDLTLRQSDDLDMLVRRQDLAAVRERFLALGYRSRERYDVADDVFVRSMHHHTFVGQSGIAVEVHWEVTERYFGFQLDPEIWHRLRCIPLSGTEVLSLAPEDLLLAICVHSSKHAWSRLLWVCDVAQLVHSSTELDWDLAWWQARKSQAERMLLLGLALASELLGTPLPTGIQKRVRSDSQLPSLVAEVKHGFLAGVSGQASGAARRDHLAFHLRLRQNVWAKARHVLRLALIPSQEDWMRFQLAGRLYPLYYLVRPARLLRKHLTSTWRRSSTARER